MTMRNDLRCAVVRELLDGIRSEFLQERTHAHVYHWLAESAFCSTTKHILVRYHLGEKLGLKHEVIATAL
jgi:hypothetical protein